MGQFFDSRRFLRTPGFAPDGLYDDDRRDIVTPLGRTTWEERQPIPDGSYNSTALDLPPELPPQQEVPLPAVQQTWNLPPPPRQRISLPPPPVEPKPSMKRQILGDLAGIHSRAWGEEIKRPGYQRAMRQYGVENQRRMEEQKINHAAAQEEAQIATARAAQARGEASYAQRDRVRGQMQTDGDFTLSGDQARFGRTGNQIAINPSPVKPLPPGVKIGPDGKLYHEPGKLFTEVPPSVALASLNSSGHTSQTLSDISEIVKKEFPGMTGAELDMKVVEMWKAQQKIASDLKSAQTERAKRPPAGRGSGGLTPNQENTEARRTVADLAAEQVSKGGSVDKAIENMNAWTSRDATAEKVLLHLHGLKAKGLEKNKGGSGGVGSLRRAAGGATTNPPLPAPAKKFTEAEVRQRATSRGQNADLAVQLARDKGLL